MITATLGVLFLLLFTIGACQASGRSDEQTARLSRQLES